MAEMVDVENLAPQQVYSLLGVMPKFEPGQLVRYSPRGAGGYIDCTIERLTIEYGKIIYVNDAGKWGYEDQYKVRLPQPATVTP